MPQILMIVPQKTLAKAPELFTEDYLDSEADRLIWTVEKAFRLEGKDDVSFTVVPAIYTKNEADIQIEVRYTCGEDEYGDGEVFEPIREQKGNLARELGKWVTVEFQKVVKSTSVWVMGFHETVFEIIEQKG